MEKTKFHFTWSLPCKIICFVLTAVLSAVMIMGGAISIYGVAEGWFDGEGSFYESDLLQSIASRTAYYASLDVYYNSDIGAADSKNMLYAVYDADGRRLAQNCDGESAYYLGQYEFDFENTGNGHMTGSLTVKCWLRAPMEKNDWLYDVYTVYNGASTYRYGILTCTLISAVCLCLCVVFLICGAGRKNGVDGVPLAWVNRCVPFDLYFAANMFAGIVLCVCISACIEGIGYWQTKSISVLLLSGLVLSISALFVLCTHVLVCFAARVKAGAWWRNTLCWRVCRLCRRLVKKLFGPVKTLLLNLPLVWKSALVFCGAALVNIVLGAVMPHSVFAFLLLFAFDVMLLGGTAVIAVQMQKLKQGGQELSRGNFDYKISTDGMLPDFRAHAEDLNSISAGMTNAINERMKSERFKTELITNVSHDIKTPLTSIVSYVDLLKKEDIQNEKAREYIEVLDRQSARLKKLTEDLVEASKASSGAVKLEPERVDVSELLRQSAGEYNERLAEAGLTTIIDLPDAPLPIMADGRRLWRIFDNLLSNVRKYAMPGTRVYITAEGVRGGVFVTFRNISARELKVTPEELMERFVRGDASRSTEGSGLGLSIARSLAELMGGCLEIFIDGDLFKAVVSFPMLYEEQQQEKDENGTV